jgi:hypothetical protein
MTTVLVLNAISSLLATVGVGGWLVRKQLRQLHAAEVRPLYATASRSRGQRR